MSGHLTGDAQLTHLRLDLFRNGYQPVPVSSPIPQHPTAGKAPFVTGWRTICATANEQDIVGWTDRYRDHGNTGILTGRVAGVDIDVPAAALADKISHLADALLGQTTLRRVGNAPKSLRCYRVSSPLQKIETPELFLTDGMKVQVEVLGEGQQFVAHGMHPVTGRPYAWLEASPELLPLSDVPMVSEDSLRTFVAASEAILRAAGGRTKKELEKEQKEAAEANKPKPEASKTSAESSDSNFFRVVNQRGLADIKPWFTAIFPTARREAGTGAWRVSSADIGRGLEEDISIHPVNGGRDFGTEESCSPIDVVIKHGGAADPVVAALFICEKLAIDPAGIGWKSKARKADRPKPDARDHDGLPTIQVTAGHLHTITTAAEQAILKAGISIYQRGGDLMRPATSEVPASSGRITTTAVLADVTAHALIDIFSCVARWQKFDARADDWVAANPPKQVAEILLSRFGHWKLPQVAGIITTPTMRPDGSILSAPGYDPATRLYHAADPAVVLMRQALEPTRDIAIRALKVLQDLLSEFPFVSEVSKSVALSALITPVVRGALSVAPLHAFRATTAGTGKSYLADIASAISSGRP